MKLLIICACEKVIVDKSNGAHSLISVTRGVETKLASPSGIQPISDVPLNAVSPQTWAIYTMWESQQDDIGQEFKYFVEVKWPNGEPFAATSAHFTADKTLIIQNSVTLLGFPVGQIGAIKIIGWIEKDGNRVSEVANYEVNVRHVPLNP